jgi:site-specific recombinase XerD
MGDPGRVVDRDVDDVVACVSAGYPVVTSPMAAVKQPTVEAKVAEFVTDSELRAIRATCQSRSRRNYRGRRCEAIIRLLGATGCQLSEIADLIVDDIDLGSRSTRSFRTCGPARRT